MAWCLIILVHLSSTDQINFMRSWGGTNKMKAAPVLAGIFQGPQGADSDANLVRLVGLAYRAARMVGTAA
jgi:hypothetical protein